MLFCLRPPFYDKPEELDARIEDYFRDEKQPTISGLCLFLGFESRQSFYDYEKKDGFAYTIKKARLKLELTYEKYLLRDGQVTGPIFALKNLGWTDKTQVENTHNFLPNIELVYEVPSNEGTEG